MNELDVIVKLYEKYLHKAYLDHLHLVCKAILLIRASLKNLHLSIDGFNVKQDCQRLRAAKTKTRFKTGIYLAFPKDWQDGSQNTHDGKSNSLRSPSL
ncbi:hypothetical protein [Nostoc sp. NZL]|uniref:hypothetical protein n=1 Tax=Nostoc sp. NZL TaxID=2650612 RepID=UPI0018C7FF93|nr:hypothetical protein [Nostoc sp. NZL]